MLPFSVTDTTTMLHVSIADTATTLQVSIADAQATLQVSIANTQAITRGQFMAFHCQVPSHICSHRFGSKHLTCWLHEPVYHFQKEIEPLWN